MIRSRNLFIDQKTTLVAIDATSSPDTILLVKNDAEKRLGKKLHTYRIGTSRSTSDTMSLAVGLDGQPDGFVHTSSMGEIVDFDTAKLKSRNLTVHHEQDGYHATPFINAQKSHEKYKTDFIAMSGGGSIGNPCKAFSHHGYYDIEAETAQKIKYWIFRQ